MKNSSKETRVTGYRIREEERPAYSAHRFARVFLRLRSGNVLYFFSAGAQMMAGILLIALAVTGHIDKAWIATVSSAIGSAVAMTGTYLFYDILRNRYNIDHLVRDAINRAISHLN